MPASHPARKRLVDWYLRNWRCREEMGELYVQAEKILKNKWATESAYWKLIAKIRAARLL